MVDQARYNLVELLTIAASRQIRDGETVFVGVGYPMLAAYLARLLHAPNIRMIVQSGVIDSRAPELPLLVGGARWSYQAASNRGGSAETLSLLPRGMIDLGFLGAAQVDKYGNLNSTCIGNYLSPKVRLAGTAGAVDIASGAKRTVIILMHEKRRIVDRVDYLTSPGWKIKKFPGGELVHRKELGLKGGPDTVVTNRGIMRFDPETKIMYLAEYFEGEDPRSIKENTGFDIDISRAVPSPPITSEELQVLREKVDPMGIWIRGRVREL